MKQIFFKVLFQFLFALSLSGFGGVVRAEPIRIGYLTDLSGKGAFLGTQSRAGAILAQEELNAAGHHVEVSFDDHQTATTAAVSAAERMLAVTKVDAIICDFTPPSIAISPLLKNAKKLFIHVAPTESIVASNPYSFRNFLDYRQGCERVAQYWQSQGLKRIGNIKLNLEFGELCLAGSQSVYPDITVFDYNSGDDLRTAVLTFKQKGIDAFLQTAYEIDMLSRLRSMRELNYAVPVGIPQPLLTSLVKEKEPQALEKSISFGFQELQPDFIDKVSARFPQQSKTNIEFAAVAYLNVKQIVSALEACGHRDIDCQVDTMSKSPSSPLLGFQGWKDRKAQYDYQLRTVVKSALVPIGQ